MWVWFSGYRSFTLQAPADLPSPSETPGSIGFLLGPHVRLNSSDDHSYSIFVHCVALEFARFKTGTYYASPVDQAHVEVVNASLPDYPNVQATFITLIQTWSIEIFLPNFHTAGECQEWRFDLLEQVWWTF